MSELIDIAPERLSEIPAATMLRLVEQSKKAKKHLEAFQKVIRDHPKLFLKFEELDIDPTFSMASGNVDIMFSGDGNKLGAVWGALRRHGYETSSHPKKGDSTFSAYWHKDGYPTMWMYFTSTLCRRVKVGTKTVVQDVYETVCGEEDLPQLTEEATPQVEHIPTFL